MEKNEEAARVMLAQDAVVHVALHPAADQAVDVWRATLMLSLLP